MPDFIEVAQTAQEALQEALGPSSEVHKGRGRVWPADGLESVLAYSRKYSGPHLVQLGEALNDSECAELHRQAQASSHVCLVDVGCGVAAASSIAAAIGNAEYVGLEPHHWLRGLASGLLAAWTYRPRICELQRALSVDDDWVQRIETHARQSGTASTAVLIVMNHVLYQPEGVRRTVKDVLTICSYLCCLPRTAVFLLSIEPRMVPLPGAFGKDGLNQELDELELSGSDLVVSSVRKLLGGSSGDAEASLVEFAVV